MKRFWRIGLVVMLVGWAGAAGAAVELLSTQSAAGSGVFGGTGVSVTLTIPEGTQLLVVSVTNKNDSSVSSVKMSSTNLQCRFIGDADPSGKDTRAAMFYYKNPPTGSQTIEATISGSTYHRAMAVMCLKGVDLSKFDAPVSSYTTAGLKPVFATNGGGSNSAISMAFSAADAPVGSMAISAIAGAGSPSVKAGTSRWTQETTNAVFSKAYYAGSTLAGSASGAALGWSCGGDWALVGAVIPAHPGPQDILVTSGASLTIGDNAPVDTIAGALQVVDPLNNAPYTWAMVDDGGGRFKLASSTSNTVNVLLKDASSIDAAQAGSYTIQVSVDDAAAGNVALVKSFTVLVTDTTLPVCGELSTSTGLAKDLDTVSFSTTITDNVAVAENPVATANGEVLGPPSKSGNVYTWTWLLPPNTPEGPASISITAVDTAGNSAVRSFNSSPVVDNTPPAFAGFSVTDTIIRPLQQGHISVLVTDLHGLAGPPVLEAAGLNMGAGTMSGNICNWYFSLPASVPEGYVVLKMIATDAVGNVKEGIASDQLILDNTAPTITSVQTSTNWACAGTEVTITATISDANGLDGIPTLSFNGKFVTAAAAGSQYTWTYTIASDEQEGAVALVFEAKDQAGNVRTFTPSSTLISIDRKAPVIAGITVSPAVAKVGATLTITASVTDNQGLAELPVMTMAGFPGGTPTQTGNIFKWVLNVPAGVSEGAALIVVTAKDNAGNQQTLSNSTLKLDPNPPTLTLLSVTPDKVKSGMTVSVVASVTDYTAVSGTPTLKIGGVSATFYGKVGTTYTWNYPIPAGAPEGFLPLEFQAADTLGNSTSYGYDESLLNDNTPPVLSNIEVSPDIAKSDDVVRITFDASDVLTAVADPPTVTVNGSTAGFYSKEGDRYEFRYTIRTADPDGMADILIVLRDTPGNSRSTHTTSVLRVDNTVPTISAITVSPKYAKDGEQVIIGFRVNDEVGLSGSPEVAINGHAAQLDGSEGDHYEYLYIVDNDRDVDGPARLAISIHDTIGNTGHSESDNLLHIDMTAPMGSLVIDEGAVFTRNTTVTLAFQPEDGASGSGVVKVSLSDDGISWLPWEDLSIAREWQLAPGKGYKRVYGRYMDRAGNVTGQPFSDTIALNPFPLAVDQESPSIVIADRGSSTVLEVSARNVFGGSVSYEWRKNGKPLSGLMGQDKVNGPVLILDALESQDVGSYTCLVADELEEVESDPFEIQIEQSAPVSGVGALGVTAGLLLLAAWRRRRG